MTIPKQDERAGLAIHENAIVGYRGHRAYVRRIGGDRVYLHWREEMLERRCRDCQGEGLISVLHGSGAIYTRDCPRCRGRGVFLAGTYTQRRWVERSEITAAAPREKADPESVALAADLYRKAGAR